MQTVAKPPFPQPLLSAPARVAGLVVAVALIAAGVSFAGHASEHAVQVAQEAISPGLVRVTLPAVQVVYRRGVGDVADAACAAPVAQRM